MSNVIFTYTEDDAINDGILVRLSKNLVVTTNLAFTLAGDDSDRGFDLAKLWSSVLPAMTRYSSGEYYDEGATNYPEEADSYHACYFIDENVVWVQPSGHEQVTMMLPEDY